jgi:hypothetical protein
MMEKRSVFPKKALILQIMDEQLVLFMEAVMQRAHRRAHRYLWFIAAPLVIALAVFCLVNREKIVRAAHAPAPIAHTVIL